MSALEEAYLPLNVNLKTNKLTYLKEIYNNIDVCDDEDINFEDFDPVLIEKQCKIYRTKMETFKLKFEIEQQSIEEISNNIELLCDCKNKLQENFDVEDIEETLKQMDILETKLVEKQESFEKSHKHTIRCMCKLFKSSAHFINNDPRNLCSVCMTNEVDVAIVPCGHTLCSLCMLKCDISHCFICRNVIEKTIKLYYI